jgi:hypothetical protein
MNGLILDRLHHARVAVADVHAHQLAVEVDVALSFRGPEVHALRPSDRYRIDGVLRRPFEDGVFLTEGDHFFARHSVPPRRNAPTVCLRHSRRHDDTTIRRK